MPLGSGFRDGGQRECVEVEAFVSGHKAFSGVLTCFGVRPQVV